VEPPESRRPRHPVAERLRAREMLVPGAALRQLADEYRQIKRPLLNNAFGRGAAQLARGNLIMVSSAVPGEGKTYTATNLALAMAQERDHTVLLVDCDVVKQDLSRMFGLDDQPGLIDVLDDERLDLAATLVRTDIPDLVVLPAGQPHDYATELLASERMRGLVEEMASRYPDRVILFDAPPLLGPPHAQVLAALVGQIALVVAADETPQPLVEEALETLGEDKAVGLILNKARGAARRYPYHGYGAG